jgi:hypothetical protein
VLAWFGVLHVVQTQRALLNAGDSPRSCPSVADMGRGCTRLGWRFSRPWRRSATTRPEGVPRLTWVSRPTRRTTANFTSEYDVTHLK